MKTSRSLSMIARMAFSCSVERNRSKENFFKHCTIFFSFIVDFNSYLSDHWRQNNLNRRRNGYFTIEIHRHRWGWWWWYVLFFVRDASPIRSKPIDRGRPLVPNGSDKSSLFLSFATTMSHSTMTRVRAHWIGLGWEEVRRVFEHVNNNRIFSSHFSSSFQWTWFIYVSDEWRESYPSLRNGHDLGQQCVSRTGTFDSQFWRKFGQRSDASDDFHSR